MTPTILIERNNDREEWMNQAMKLSARKAHEMECIVTVVVPAKQHSKSTPLQYLFDNTQLNKLNNGEEVLIDNIVPLRVVSPVSQNNHSSKQVLLIVSARNEHIPKIRAFQNVVFRYVMPYQKEDADAWKQYT